MCSVHLRHDIAYHSLSSSQNSIVDDLMSRIRSAPMVPSTLEDTWNLVEPLCRGARSRAVGARDPSLPCTLALFVETVLLSCASDLCLSKDLAIMLSRPESADAPSTGPTQAWVTLLGAKRIQVPKCELRTKMVASDTQQLSSSATASINKSTPYAATYQSSSSSTSSLAGQQSDIGSEIVRSNAPPADPTLDFHILPRPGPVCVVPTFLLAADDIIYDCLLAALCQQQALGLSYPIVGFASSQERPSLRVLFAWFPPSEAGHGTNLPRMHVAEDAEQEARSRTGLGTLDLADEPSARRAVARLAALAPYFTSSGNASITRPLIPRNALHWRADQAPRIKPAVQWTRNEINNWISTQEDSTEMVSCEADVFLQDPPADDEACGITMDEYIIIHQEGDPSEGVTNLWLLDRMAFLHTVVDSALVKPKSPSDAPLLSQYLFATRLVVWQGQISIDDMPSMIDRTSSLPQILSQSFASFPRPHLGARFLAALDEALPQIWNITLQANTYRGTDLCFPPSRCFSDYHHILQVLMFDSSPSSAASVLNHFQVPVALPRNDLCFETKHHSYEATLARCRTMQCLHELYMISTAEAICDHDSRAYDYTTNALRRFGIDIPGWRTGERLARGRAEIEPYNGVCDCVTMVRIPGIFPAQLAAKAAAHSFVRPHGGSPDAALPLRKWTPGESFRQRRQQKPDSLLLAESFDIVGAANIDDAQPVCDEVYIARASPRTEQDGARPTGQSHADGSVPLFLPLLITTIGVDTAEFDPFDGHRLRMLLTSAVKFLASLDIFDFPVYGLYTEDTICTVVVAWSLSSAPKEVRIYDRNCVAYNISTPQGLYTFATFLLWLRLYHAEDLRSKMDSARLETFLQRLESDDPRVLWTRAQQHI